MQDYYQLCTIEMYDNYQLYFHLFKNVVLYILLSTQ